MAAKADTSCSEVTEISYPMEIEYFERPDHAEGGLSMPSNSPGSSMPVLLPKPKESSVLYRDSLLYFFIDSMIPTLQEYRIISGIPICP